MSTIAATRGPRVEELRPLMEAVQETTVRLERTHAALQVQVHQLKRELADANARLRRSRTLAALGEMAAGIAHEVCNPLGSIRLYAQVLAEELACRPEQAALCGRIARAVEDLDAIVRDVLSFARHRSLKVAPTTAEALLEHALEICSGLIGSAGVEVEGPAGGARHKLEADQGLVVQALANVIRNAVEAMSGADTGPRRLSVGASRRRLRTRGGLPAERVVLAVGDAGPGVAPSVLARMFNPFFTTRKTGTGLGLAIVHRIVDAHGGHVAVTNGPGGGALVELCLPERPPPSPRPARPHPPKETYA